MKILFVINSLGPGGAEQSLAEMLPGLREAGIDSIVACLHPKSMGLEPLLRHQGFDIRFLSDRRIPSNARSVARWSRQLRGIIRREEPDIVHTSIFEAHMAGRLAAVGTPSIVVSTVTNSSYDPVRLQDPDLRPWRLQAVRAIDGLSSRYLTSHFHAITRAVKSEAVRTMGVPPSRVTVVERGRDPARLGTATADRKARVRARLGLREDDQVLINLGRQDFQKGQRYLLEAVESLSRTRPNLVTLVAGRHGGVSSELQELHARTGLGDRFRVLGHRDDVPELLAGSDLFVFPSLYEGLGCAVIEAMALGLPIVASDLAPVREVVEPDRNATLVPPGKVAPLASAISNLLDDPSKARAFGLRGRTIFEERFTLDRIVDRMVDLYQALVDQSLRDGGSARRRLRLRKPPLDIATEEPADRTVTARSHD